MNKEIISIINEIEKEVDAAYYGVEEYANNLESTDVITDHLKNIYRLIKKIKED